MLHITYEHVEHYQRNGWVLVPLSITSAELQHYYNSVRKLRDTAIRNRHPFSRTYYPHLFHENVAAIEAPLHSSISNPSVDELFYRLALGRAVQKLAGWSDVYLHLIRLFTMSRYSYLGPWHRDTEDRKPPSKSISTIQVGLYLSPQDGFRLAHLELDDPSTGLFNDIAPDALDQNELAYKLHTSQYSEIKGLPGSVLFFMPGLLHQGNCRCTRLDFHMRFGYFPSPQSSASSPLDDHIQYADFMIPQHLAPNCPLDSITSLPRRRNILFKERLINSTNYYSAVFNIYHQFRLLASAPTGKPRKRDVFGNTIFQS